MSRRLFAITACVALLHAAGLWALASGLQREPVPLLVPVTLVADMVPAAGPAPATLPRAQAPIADRARPLQAAAQHTLPPAAAFATTPAPSTAPAPAALPAHGLTGAVTAANATAATSGAATAVPWASPAPDPPGQPGQPAPGAMTARVDLPSSNAVYLRNPKPAYPPQSRRLGEQGQVVVRVFIGADGLPERAQVHQTSGHDRLDQAALATVLNWRYVPGKRGGVPEAMWFNVAINFVLE